MRTICNRPYSCTNFLSCENSKLKGQLTAKDNEMQKLHNTISFLQDELKHTQSTLGELEEVEKSEGSDLVNLQKKYDELLERQL